MLSEDFIKHSLYCACRALDELHRKNIVFGEFNPDCVLMKSNGDIKLANFSNSVILAQPSGNDNLLYVAPEVLVI